MPPARADAARNAKVDRSRYEVVRSLDRLNAWIARARDIGLVAVDSRTNSLDPMQATLCGLSLALAPNEACYIPLAHRTGGDGGTGGLFAGPIAPDQIEESIALAALKPLLEDPGVLKIGNDLKYDLQIFALRDIELAPYDDTMLMSYVVDSGRSSSRDRSVGAALLRSRHDRCQRDHGIGKIPHHFRLRPDRQGCRIRGRASRHGVACSGTCSSREWPPSTRRRSTRHWSVPWCRCSRAWNGAASRSIVRCFRGYPANSPSAPAALEAEIQTLAGEPLNPGSPKQLGDILFGKFGLPGGTKTKTGQWSTGARVLDDLAEQGHPLPRKILDWRQVSKLKSTYTDALPGYVDARTHRVHTSYALAATPTGRLSSSEPNLQNIPIRNEEGRKIRRAFVATEGRKLVSADYSQIELRLLAEIADIAQLKNAFREGLDIHAMTASEMFGVPVKGMPAEVRRRAKAINFGIIYGISAFGLANQLGIEREEAGAYIKKYFERFPGIRAYMDETKASAKKNGYVLTLFGRKCHYPEIAHSNASIRAFNERAAINARLQGTAADIIRRAMVRMDAALAKKKLSAQMLLQVHDELVFEVPDDEVEATLPVVKKVMEDAPMPALSLAVPLAVDARAAHNWDEAH